MTKADKAARAAAKREEREAARAEQRAEREREREAKLAKAEHEKKTALGHVETIGKQISSLVDKINREEDAAIDAYNKHAGHSTTFREELKTKLEEAEPLCKAAGMTLKQMKDKYIGDRLSTTQFKQLLRVARGAITFQDIKNEEAERKRKQREESKAKAKAEAEAKAKAEAEANAEGRDNAPVPTTKPDTLHELLDKVGNVSSEKRDAIRRDYADKDGTIQPEHLDAARTACEAFLRVGANIKDEAPPIAPAAPEPQIPERALTPDEISDDALVKFKAMVAELCPLMTARDLGQARQFISNEKLWRPKLKKAA